MWYHLEFVQDSLGNILKIASVYPSTLSLELAPGQSFTGWKQILTIIEWSLSGKMKYKMN